MVSITEESSESLAYGSVGVMHTPGRRYDPTSHVKAEDRQCGNGLSLLASIAKFVFGDIMELLAATVGHK